MYEDKNVVLGVTGSIAAYKAVDIASKLTQRGVGVDVVMTRASMQFIAPLTFRSITHRPVVTDMFELASEYSVEHVALAERADVVLIAPATANTIAKIAAGIADEMVLSTVLATRAPVVLAPAMDVGMWDNAVTLDNVARLSGRGFIFVGPVEGRLASGLVGMGRLIENEDILGTVYSVLGRSGDLAGRKLVVSAGGTHEPVDMVRFIGNRSSGKMGYAIAEAARDRGAAVTLVSGPSSVATPAAVDTVRVQTAAQMRDSVHKASKGADAVVMAAAVADYRPASAPGGKIKRESESLTLELVKTPDIIGELDGDFVKVGFAAEHEDGEKRGGEKLRKKGLDLIVVNDITAEDSGFEVDTNRVSIVDRNGSVERLPLLPKSEVAHRILDKLADLLSVR